MTRTLRAVAIVALVIAALIPAAVPAQQPEPHRPPHVPGNPADEAVTAEMEKRRAKAANNKRHEDLKRDTDHLLQLATELKQEVDKSSENTLSLGVIKKAEEIEKLAKSVREKMRGF